MTECLKGGDWCVYTEAAERIEKLERENETLNIRLNAREEVLDHIRSQLIALGSRADARRITTAISDIAQERDTALRALAEARRDAERLAKALDPFVRFNSSEAFIKLSVPTTTVREGRAAIAEYALRDVAASQPEKDANNG